MVSYCYEKTLEYCKNRVQFGKAIGNYQLIQKNLVEMCGLVCAMQSLCLRMSLKEAKGERVSHGQSSLLKAFCSQKTREVVALGRDCLGGNGILLEYEVGREVAHVNRLQCELDRRLSNSNESRSGTPFFLQRKA